MDGQPETLGINVGESIKTQDAFGAVDKQLKTIAGVAGTLHLVDENNKQRIVDMAWELSQKMQLPVIIVVRAPRTV